MKTSTQLYIASGMMLLSWVASTVALIISATVAF
jgi:hypothetical protein